MKESKDDKPQKIIVFQQKGSGKLKIEGLQKYGDGNFQLEIINIDDELPSVLDDTSDYLPTQLDCDLVLDFLKHNDLSTDLAALCYKNGIPLVSSGKKLPGAHAITPPTCCGLPRQDGLGAYGNGFGAPDFVVEIANGLIKDVRVLRGAPCGATWDAAQRLIGHPAEDAVRKIGLETQFYCYADTAGWDPIYGKSPVHFAGKIHAKNLEKAIKKAIAQEK